MDIEISWVVYGGVAVVAVVYLMTRNPFESLDTTEGKFNMPTVPVAKKAPSAQVPEAEPEDEKEGWLVYLEELEEENNDTLTWYEDDSIGGGDLRHRC